MDRLSRVGSSKRFNSVIIDLQGIIARRVSIIRGTANRTRFIAILRVIVSKGSPDKPPFKSELKRNRIQQLVRSKGIVFGNLFRNKHQHVEGIRRIMSTGLHMANIVYGCRIVVCRFRHPLLAGVPCSVSHLRAISFTTRRLNGSRNLHRRLFTDKHGQRINRRMPFMERGIRSPFTRVTVPVEFIKIGGHKVHHRMCTKRQRIANVVNCGRLLGKKHRSKSQCGK